MQNDFTFDELLPVSVESLPVSDESVPVSGESFPVSGESFPVSDESLPVFDESLPVSVKSLPVSDESHFRLLMSSAASLHWLNVRKPKVIYRIPEMTHPKPLL